MMDGAALHAFTPVHLHSSASRRRPCPPRAAASPGTGFGKKPAPGPANSEVTSPGDGQAAPASGAKKSKRATASKVDRLLEAAGVPDARPVDAKEAARGRVDFAQAVTWDERAIAALPRSDDMPLQKAGRAQKKSVTAGSVLDNIQIASFTPGDGGAVPGAASEPSTAAGSSSSAVGPFYEQVVRRMQYLDARGEFSISSDRRVAPLPPPQTWEPALVDVAQYLTDIAAVTAATQAAAQLMHQEGGADAQLSAWLLSPHAAGRVQAVHRDAATVAHLLALTSPAAPSTLRVSAMAGAYVQVLTGLGTRGSMAALCAHGFVQRVTSLTFGSTVVRPLVFRIAAQAAHAAGQPLELVAFEAAPGKQLAGLREDMEGIGAALQAQPDALAAFWQELADAVKRTGLLLAPLAKNKG